MLKAIIQSCPVSTFVSASVQWRRRRSPNNGLVIFEFPRAAIFNVRVEGGWGEGGGGGGGGRAGLVVSEGKIIREIFAPNLRLSY